MESERYDQHYQHGDDDDTDTEQHGSGQVEPEWFAIGSRQCQPQTLPASPILFLFRAYIFVLLLGGSHRRACGFELFLGDLYLGEKFGRFRLGQILVVGRL